MFSLSLIVPVDFLVKEEIAETVNEFVVIAKVCAENQEDDEIADVALLLV